ncbi:MAG: HAMP domain-containing sensor histidine kinase, partial [Gemmatimonas sp.]
AIPTMRFSTTNGSVRWQFGAATESSADSAARGRMQSQMPDARVPIAIPIRTDKGVPLGTMDAEVRLSALLPLDSIPILLNDAQLTVTDRRSGQALTLPGLGDAPNDVSNYAVNGQRWIAQHRITANALLMVTAAAPTRAYVAPFEQSARIGLLVLFGVTVMVLALTAFFTARITQSLERLAGAADAVAAGDLTRAVNATGDDEVGQLARSFNTMIESLRRTLQELSQREALAAVGEFATTLSHEVRNGLTAVRIDLERVEESGPAAPESPALVARTLRNVHRLNSTVTGALAVARSGRTELHAVNLRAVLSAAAAAAEGAFAGTGSSLATLLNGSAEYFVRGDSVALEQLFLNVLLNAGQAMTQGGSATLELTMAGNECIVSLCDSGPGLTADQLSRVGQAFQTSKRDGTGLGVSIARKIAEAHGGQLLIQNGPRGGLVVRVTLPGYVQGSATLAQMESSY